MNMKSNLLPRLLALGFVFSPLSHAADGAAPANSAPSKDEAAAVAPATVEKKADAGKKSDCEGDCDCKKCKRGMKHKSCKKCKTHKHDEQGAGHEEHQGEHQGEKN
jgi:hypothetical protein